MAAAVQSVHVTTYVFLQRLEVPPHGRPSVCVELDADDSVFYRFHAGDPLWINVSLDSASKSRSLLHTQESNGVRGEFAMIRRAAG
jgi:hypothetical protein